MKGARITSVFTPEVRAVLLIVLVFFLRFLWLEDMEFKGDEKYTANYLATLGMRAFAPATEPSGHSGVMLSNGFYYFLNFFPVNYDYPLNIVRMISGLNALAISVGLWMLRRSRAGVLAFALSGTSLALVQGSRKIWYPDLVPFWVHLGLVFFWVSSLWSRSLSRDIAVAFSTFCFVVAGHMYMPGLMVGGCACAAIFLTYAWQQDWWRFKFACIGLLAGFLTWIPWLIFIFSGTGALGHGGPSTPLDWQLLEPILRHLFTLPSTFPFYGAYIRPAVEWMARHYPVGGDIPFWFDWARFSVFSAGVMGVGLFWISLGALVRFYKSWRTQPMVVAFVLMVVLISPALFLSHLGSYLHYWLGVMPFAFHWIAQFPELVSNGRLRKWIYFSTWTLCLVSTIAALSFAKVVHLQRGLPGEYGPAWSAEAN